MRPLLREKNKTMALISPGDIGIIGCYSLHLYCSFENAEQHEFGEFPHEYTDEFGSRCRAQARLDGWKLFRDGKAMCPKCAKKKR